MDSYSKAAVERASWKPFVLGVMLNVVFETAFTWIGHAMKSPTVLSKSR